MYICLRAGRLMSGQGEKAEQLKAMPRLLGLIEKDS